MLACNTVLMKLNANSSFTSLQHPVASFTTAAMRLELQPTRALPSKSQTWTLSITRPNSPVLTENKKSASLAMVVPELDAATMLACNIVLTKMIASFSSTSLRRLDASFTTAATRLEFLLTLVLPLRSLVLQLRQRKLQQVWV